MEMMSDAITAMTELLLLLIMAVMLISPAVLTVYNIYSLFRPWAKLGSKGRHMRRIAVLATSVIGIVDCFAYGEMVIGLTEKEFDVPLVNGGPDYESFHTAINGQYGKWFVVMCILAVLSLCILQLFMGVRKPPLVSVLLIGLCDAGVMLSVVYILQTINYVPQMLVIWVYPLNLFMIFIRVFLDEMSFQCEILKDKDKSGAAGIIYAFLSDKRIFVTATLVTLLPITGILLMILILTGQGADSLVKAFTMTADWVFSTQIPPPPVEYEGHYLCTVAAGGHQKVVKPVRMGIRNGKRIVVNRQLMIANAFEDLIMDRMPRFHRIIRRIYDTCGYPLSRHITDKYRADAVYILMKPLEWIFLLTLYLFDNDPESRINIQYTGKKYRTFVHMTEEKQ
ncbi:MAG: hypothetical protein J6N70_17840 [Oribacterium sp.]|nr:hypothetical protein [Oribacterium sp.]MBQ5331568.1 hypothetical protein [Oscillospiraceae bacterium]